MMSRVANDNQVVVLLGGTSCLGLAMAKEYIAKKNTKLIFACRNHTKYLEKTSFIQDSSKISFFNYDAELNGSFNLNDLIKDNPDASYTFIYLPALKDDKIEKIIKVNLISPIEIYEILRSSTIKFSYIIVGSQGDVHGSPKFPLYNSSKAALSNYFESVIYSESSSNPVYFIKPWIFSSSMTKDSKIISFLSIKTTKLAQIIIDKCVGKSKFIVYPRFTYFLVNLLKILSLNFLYKIFIKLR